MELGLPWTMGEKNEEGKEDQTYCALGDEHPGVSLPVTMPTPLPAPSSRVEELELPFVSL